MRIVEIIRRGIWTIEWVLGQNLRKWERMRRIYWLRKAKRQPSVSERKPPVERWNAHQYKLYFDLELPRTDKPRGPPNPEPAPKKRFAASTQNKCSSTKCSWKLLPKPWNKALFLRGTTSLHTILLRLIIPPPPIPAIYRQCFWSAIVPKVWQKSRTNLPVIKIDIEGAIPQIAVPIVKREIASNDEFLLPKISANLPYLHQFKDCQLLLLRICERLIWKPTKEWR